ncbi:MAG: hypothetical protein ISN28_03040 [Ectothiorhodospiraceae bacterium AqS1]|nr:hypothetical protein [Ectothiorhodospiraceae bacterium AqS1]
MMTTLQLVTLFASLIGSVGGFAWFLAGRIKEFETRMVSAIGDLRGEIGYLRGRIDGKELSDI